LKRIKKYFNHLYRKINKLPISICLEVCSLCQLDCPDCHMRKKDSNCIVGNGYLKFNDFKKFIEKNPYIERVEISFCGEIFLNPELPEIIKYANEKEIQLTAFNGVNFNTISDEMLEMLVKYKFTGLTFSIDGASPETYSIYRRKGDFKKVIDNIKKLNTYKKMYKSKYPVLKWQYIVFEHNRHEIEQAIKISKELGTYIYFKAPWHDNDTLHKLTHQEKIQIRQALDYKISDNEILEVMNNNIWYECYSP